MAHTIEQGVITAARISEHLDAKEQAIFIAGFVECIKYQSFQSPPHPIKVAQVRQAFELFFNEQITFSRMVEILNEIAEGKHKERIEI
jgi:hypothetical protein